MTKKDQKKLPDFSEMRLDEIAEFWDEHDSADYWDLMEDVTGSVRIKRPTKTISLRLAEGDLKQIKRLAQKRGIGHTTLIRMWINEMLEKQSVK